MDELDARFDEEDEFFSRSEELTNAETPDKISTAWRRLADEQAADEYHATDQTFHAYDGDELIDYVNSETATLENGAPITIFRYDNGEEHDWSVILNSTLTSGKLVGDPEVGERPTRIQWAISTIMSVWQCRHCHRIVPSAEKCLCTREPGKMRRYQVGVEHDSDANDGRFAAGVTQWVWLKVPTPTTMDAGDYAEAWAKAHCFAPAGVASMKSCLLTWIGQGIKFIRVQYRVDPHAETSFPRAGDYERVEKFYSWAECQANMRLVQAASRARRAASTAEYVPETHSTTVNVDDIEDVSL